ncbi:hypothetical protein HDU67_001910 [Dinochytrium kinnereticum]|nr:hypothetical protein HDU67_001910 [Dinochytrium kinnereticum]
MVSEPDSIKSPRAATMMQKRQRKAALKDETAHLQKIMNRHRLLISNYKEGKGEKLFNLVFKWKSVGQTALADLQTLVGGVDVRPAAPVIDLNSAYLQNPMDFNDPDYVPFSKQVRRNLTLDEIAKALQFNIEVLGQYDSAEDRFMDE